MRQRNAREKLDDAGGAPRNLLDRAAVAVADHRRHRATPPREMAEQIDKEGQVALLHRFSYSVRMKRPPVVRAGSCCFRRPRQCLARQHRADVVTADQRGEIVGVDRGIDGHQAAAGSEPTQGA